MFKYTCDMLEIYFILSQSEIWHNLGVCALKTDPSVSQHALIESLELNSENGQAWTTLGILYLKHGNEQKAHQALRNSFFTWNMPQVRSCL